MQYSALVFAVSFKFLSNLSLKFVRRHPPPKSSTQRGGGGGLEVLTRGTIQWFLAQQKGPQPIFPEKPSENGGKNDIMQPEGPML